MSATNLDTVSDEEFYRQAFVERPAKVISARQTGSDARETRRAGSAKCPFRGRRPGCPRGAFSEHRTTTSSRSGRPLNG